LLGKERGIVMNNHKCFGTTEYSAKMSLCMACKYYKQCGDVLHKVRRPKRKLVFGKEDGNKQGHINI